jgi:glycosyltransferase involved in cell wall biosynthesis
MADPSDRRGRPIKVVIQIPCLNEEATLPMTVADLPREIPGVDVVEWLVIDDGSDDRTAEVARELGVHHVVRHPRNRGLAAAFMTGLDAALRAGADVVVNTDADNQYDGGCIASIVAPVLEGRADIVVGERPIESIPEFSWAKKRLQRVGSWVVRKFSGTEIADAASGFRAFSREAALRLQVFGKHTYTLETLVQAGAEGLAVMSLPIRVNPQTRESRLVRSSGQYVRRSAQTIVRSFVLYRPFKFFFVAGLVPFVLGLVLSGRWLVLAVIEEEYRSRIPSLLLAAAFLLVAVQIWALAFMSDLQAASRRVQSEIRLRQRIAEFERRD